jgi:hypothetical protein
MGHPAMNTHIPKGIIVFWIQAAPGILSAIVIALAMKYIW